MKNTVKIIVWVVVSLVVLGLIGIGLYFMFLREVPTNIQPVDNSTGVISEIMLPSGVRLSKGTITKNDNVYLVEMIATNETKKFVNMEGYRLSFRNNNNEEIEYFSGNVVGNLDALETRNFIIESYVDLSQIDKIVYEEFMRP